MRTNDGNVHLVDCSHFVLYVDKGCEMSLSWEEVALSFESDSGVM